MNEVFDLEKTVTRLFTPQEKLAPWIFDDNGKMLPDVREGLLDIADKVVDETIAGIEGLEVYEVYLTGSSSGLLYYDKSDIDLKIEVHNTGCKEIRQDENVFRSFLTSLQAGFFAHKYNLYFHGRFVDVKIVPKPIEFMSLYSIKNDKWIIKPWTDFVNDFNVEDFKSHYLKKKAEMLAEFEKIKAENKGISLGLKMEELYTKIFGNIKTVEEYFVYKLLHYERLIKPIKEQSILGYAEAYRQKGWKNG